MNTDVESIDAALAAGGWRAGAEALVAGWVDHQPDEIGWEETWEPDDRCREAFERPGGERLVIEWVSGDTWELSIEWPDGWGREHVDMGWRETLQETAWRIVQAEGPFGGPQHPREPICAFSYERGKRFAGDVELRFELLREDLAAYFFIARNGTLNNLWVISINPAHLPAALDSLERTPRCAPTLWVKAHGERRAWSFTAWRPLLARARLGAQELLLSCPDASTAIVLAHAAGRLQAAVKLDMRELPEFDAVAWLAHATPWPTTRYDLKPAGSTGLIAPPTVVQANEDPPPPPPVREDPIQPPPPTDAFSTRGAEVPELAPEHAEPASPRFVLAPDPSPQDMQRHFSDVEAAIPPRLTGAATAVELWSAVREAHKRGALPITGNWVDLVAELHHRGFLPHLPGDRASRAALLILAKLSPLVRRLHHRRWALGG